MLFLIFRRIHGMYKKITANVIYYSQFRSQQRFIFGISSLFRSKFGFFFTKQFTQIHLRIDKFVKSNKHLDHFTVILRK